MGNVDKKNIQLTEKEWQVILDSLSNTIFNEEITEEARKNAKESRITCHSFSVN